MTQPREKLTRWLRSTRKCLKKRVPITSPRTRKSLSTRAGSGSPRPRTPVCCGSPSKVSARAFPRGGNRAAPGTGRCITSTSRRGRATGTTRVTRCSEARLFWNEGNSRVVMTPVLPPLLGKPRRTIPSTPRMATRPPLAGTRNKPARRFSMTSPRTFPVTPKTCQHEPTTGRFRKPRLDRLLGKARLHRDRSGQCLWDSAGLR
mmetsp:Transcript_114/g.344  ORF Transcript_114/g.344 Transcript_114/m.344 type:complete len:204 (+) Transcript_114:79-690(+)